MHPIIHFAVSAILFFIFYQDFGYLSLVVFIGGSLVDFDHYILYVRDKFDFNPINCYKYITSNYLTYRDSLYIFHNLELLILAAIASVFNYAFMPLTAGLASHYILDFINEMVVIKQNVKPWSVILFLLKR